MVMCPKCNADLDFDEDELDEGDEFTCGECAANLRVTSLDPVEMESSEAEEEEEEDDFDEDEEEEDEDEEEESEGDEDYG